MQRGHLSFSYVILLVKLLPGSLDEVIDGADVVMYDFKGRLEEWLVKLILQQLKDFFLGVQRFLVRQMTFS